MLGLTDEVKLWGDAGAILVKVDFLDAGGNVEESLPPRVVTDFRLTPGKFVFLAMETERPDCANIDSFWKEADGSWTLNADGYRKTFTLSPLTDKKQLKTIREWKASVEFPEGAIEELESLFNEM